MKRLLTESLPEDNLKLQRRYHVSPFNIKEDCLYCGRFLGKSTKLPSQRRSQSHNAATKELLASVSAKSLERADSWGEAVHIRIQNIGDLVAAEAKYHHDCQVRFYSGKQQLPNIKSKGRPSGTVDTEKNDAFHKLCDHIDNNNLHQYSISDLISLLKKYSDEGDYYTAKHLKVRLQEHYRDNLIITSEYGKETIYTFLNHGNAILRDRYKATGISAEDIVDFAATLIVDQIRSFVYNSIKYPKFSDLRNSEIMVS